jgi:uncharacterized membrane protein YdfJ with MMPL/SSD domain
MQEAAFSNLIEDIFIIILIYYAIKFISQLFLPVLAKKVVEKASQQFQQQQQYQNTNQQQSKNSNDKPHETKNVGEYIDYEEVE